MFSKKILASTLLAMTQAVIDESKCETDFACMKLNGCSLSDTTCTIVSWKESATGIDFTITHKTSSSSAWGGFAIANSRRMGDGDTYLCQLASSSGASNPELVSYWMQGTGRPPKSDSVDQITNPSFEKASNNLFECKFTRPHKLNDGQ